MRDVADEQHAALSDLIVTILANHFNRPDLAPQARKQQEALPLANSA